MGSGPEPTAPDDRAGTGMLDRLLRRLGVPDGPPVRHPSTPVPRAHRSLAHEVVLALLDPDSGRWWTSTGAQFHVVPAALLVEMAHEGRLEVSRDGRKTRATVCDPTPVGDPDVDAALLRIRAVADGRTIAQQVDVLPRTRQLVTSLVERGELLAEEGRRFGLVPVRRFRPRSPAEREALVGRVCSALLGESVPDARTALLIALLDLALPLELLVAKREVTAAQRRAQEILEGLGEGERALVAAVRAARDRSER